MRVRDVFAIYDNNISPGKIIILYFIQIRHTDDFPPTGTPASVLNWCNSEMPPSKQVNGHSFTICLIVWCPRQSQSGEAM